MRRKAASLLREANIPVVFYQWPDGSDPQFPCIRYVDAGRDDFIADGKNYFKKSFWRATLITESKDDATEAALESVFEAKGIVYSKGDTVYVRDERLFQVDYTFTLSE